MSYAAIKRQLRRDPFIRPLVDEHFSVLPTPPQERHLSLIKSIVGQQLHTRAADKIWRRFQELFKTSPPSLEQIHRIPQQQLRSIGLSQSKCESIQQLCNLMISQEITDTYWLQSDQEKIIAKLCSVKGIGLWTAEMFLLFGCGRPDIFSLGDYALKDAMIKLYNLTSTGKELSKEVESISLIWSPHRSYAALILWAWRDACLKRS